MENIFVEFLPPWIETGLQPAFYDKESGTVLQQTARMYARVNMLIRMFNKLSKNTKTTVEDYINQFNELHDYVHDYFDNLDVQEEINNKLDAMAESGQLATIIAQYVGLTKVYDTQADLLADTFITSGFAKTLGLAVKGDGFGALYKIDETGDLQLASGAYATMLSNFGGNNYYDFTVETETHSNTTCYIITIPLKDSNNKQIDPYIDLCRETGPLVYSQEHNTSLTINASLGSHTVIGNGEVLQNRDSTNNLLPDAAYYLGLKADRTMVDYQANLATAEAMLADGATQAWLAFYRLIKDNNYVDFNEIDEEWADEGANIATSRHPRQCIGQKNDKSIVILTTEGRRAGEPGLTSEECADILHDRGCINAWNLDGGGSTSTEIKGYKINSNIDDHFTSDRIINSCLNVKNLITNEELANINAQIGKVTQLNNNKLMTFINQSVIESAANDDVNEYLNKQSIKYIVNATNTPYGAGYIFSYPITLPNVTGQYGAQLFIDRRTGRTYTRAKFEDSFKDWKPTEGYLGYLYSRPTSYFSVTTNDTYEKVTLENTTITTNVSGYNSDFMTINENSEIEFSGNMDKMLLIITFDLSTTNTQGTRYVKVKNGDDDVTTSISQYQALSTQTVSTHTITCIVDSTKNVTLNVYGKENDRISRIKVVARSFN